MGLATKRRTASTWTSRGTAAALCLLAALYCGQTAALSFAITDLGTLGGGWSRAYAINDFGQVTGQSDTGSATHAFIWDSGSGMQSLGTLGGSESIGSFGWDINDAGQIAGWSATPETSSGQAFFWDPDSGMEGLGTVGPNMFSRAFGINNAGQVTGSLSGIASPERGLFVWTEGIGMEVLVSGPNIAGRSINDAGQVAYNHSGVGAFLWDPILGEIPLGTLGGSNASALRINNTGQIIGGSDTSSGATHAFLWDSDDGMHDLGVLAGFDVSRAWGVNDAGWVVGRSGDELHFQAEGRAFLHDGTQMWDLNDLIDPLSGWHLHAAFDINNHGQIVGWGTYNGGERAFLLTPDAAPVIPEPSTITLLGLGAGALASRSFRPRRPGRRAS